MLRRCIAKQRRVLSAIVACVMSGERPRLSKDTDSCASDLCLQQQRRDRDCDWYLRRWSHIGSPSAVAINQGQAKTGGFFLVLSGPGRWDPMASCFLHCLGASEPLTWSAGSFLGSPQSIVPRHRSWTGMYASHTMHSAEHCVLETSSWFLRSTRRYGMEVQ